MMNHPQLSGGAHTPLRKQDTYEQLFKLTFNLLLETRQSKGQSVCLSYMEVTEKYQLIYIMMATKK